MAWQQEVENGNIDVLSDINTLVDEKTGARPLHYAAKGGQCHVVQFLIQKNVNIDATDKFGRTSLFLAVLYQHAEVVELLLSAKASPDITCKCGTTAVSKAAENGDIKTLKFLLKKGASWNTQNQDGETPQQLAIRNGHQIVHGTFKSYESDRLRNFWEAARNGSVEEMKDLIMRSGVDLNTRNPSGHSALDLAVQQGQTEVVRFLLQDRTISQMTSMQRAQVVDGRERTALHWAAKKNNRIIVELLLEAGASTNARDRDGRTPLDYYEARRGRKEPLGLSR